jgi:hypothetical protein
MNERRESISPDPDEPMRRFLVATLAADDPATASGAELEAGTVYPWSAGQSGTMYQWSAEPFSEERAESLLKKVEVLMREASQRALSESARPIDDDSDDGSNSSNIPVQPTLSTGSPLGFLGNWMSNAGWPDTLTLGGYLVAILSATTLALAFAVVFLVLGAWSKEQGAGSKKRQVANLSDSMLHAPRSELSMLPASVARLGRLAGVRWSKPQLEGSQLGTGPQLEFGEMDRLTPGQDIRLEAGRAEIQFDVGVQMVVEGPAHVRILGPLQARAFFGKITAHVDKNAHGFSIVTPQGKVVDLGTNFGLRIDGSGREEIAVFEGEVDIDYPLAHSEYSVPDRSAGGARSGPPTLSTGCPPALPQTKRRLTAGEAVCVNREGELARLPAITNETFPRSVQVPPAHASVIAAVADNIRLPESAQFYEVVHGGLEDGVQSYVDRTCKWRSVSAAGLPDELRGADYVKTFNNDKLRQDYELTILLASAADLYVFTDDRVMAPDWVRANFQPTGSKIGMEQEQSAPRELSAIPSAEAKNVSFVFSVWRLSVQGAGAVKLGRLPTYPTGKTQALGLNWTAANMYGIAAVPRSTTVPLAAGYPLAGRGTAGTRNAAGQATILQSRSVNSIIKELGAVPRPEHPRPDQFRGDWLNLNGVWEFAFDREAQGQKQKWQDKPALEQKIVVPFAPESVLSGINDEGFHRLCWYARNFHVPDALRQRRLLLHFGAVDYRAEVWLNGRRLGDHEGGYAPFDFDVTKLVKPSGNRLVVRVEDDPGQNKPRGKQCPDLHPGGSVYSRVTGIWQTVWLEAVGPAFARDWTVRADLDTGVLVLDVHVDAGTMYPSSASGLRLEAEVVRNGESVASGGGAVAPDNSASAVIRVSHPLPWSPESPALYDLDLRLVDASGREIDRVKSYFAFRKIEVRNGHYLLNGRPFFLISALDQGYNPAGLYTPPSDEFQREDVLWAKRYGLNSIRKHQIVPEPRFFYWCDRLGLTVWAEMADWGCDLADCDGFLRQWRPRVLRDINHPSIITWVPLNEQGRDPKVTGNMVRIYDETHRLDSTRPVLDNSGWGHTKTDITDLHTNAPDFRDWWGQWRRSIAESGNFWLEPGLPAFNSGFRHQGQPVVISEVGLWRIDGFGPLGPWSEYGSTKVPTVDAYLDLYCDVIVGLMSEPDCAGFSYVQLYDVEGEVNGYLTYDRRPKVPPEVIRMIHAYGLGRHWANRDPISREAVSQVQTLCPSSRDAAQPWRFTTMTPNNGWKDRDFDDSAWRTGPGGFGTDITPGAVVRTVWDTPDIWIRRTFDFSGLGLGLGTPSGGTASGDAAADGKLFLELHHDEDAEIYLNGTPIKTVEGFVTRYMNLPLDAAAVKALRQGRNTIAVHCHNTTGGQYIDVGLVYVKPQ